MFLDQNIEKAQKQFQKHKRMVVFHHLVLAVVLEQLVNCSKNTSFCKSKKKLYLFHKNTVLLALLWRFQLNLPLFDYCT